MQGLGEMHELIVIAILVSAVVVVARTTPLRRLTWRPEPTHDRALACSFCGAEHSGPGSLVLGADTAICRSCVTVGRTAIDGRPDGGLPEGWRMAATSAGCLFCYNSDPRRGPVVARDKGQICAACIAICESCFQQQPEDEV